MQLCFAGRAPKTTKPGIHERGVLCRLFLEDLDVNLFSALAMTLLALAATSSFAQVAPFCNAGIRPDGFVDFSLLPPAPDSTASAPFTAILPVAGVGGLTMTLTIPASTSNHPGPLFVVQGGTLYLFAGSPLLTLQFSAKVAGVSLLASSMGRGQSFTLGDPLKDQQAPGLFGNTVESYVLAPTSFSTPLQQVELPNGFTATSVSGGPVGAYDSPAIAGISNLRVQSSAANAAATVPMQGLEQWLRSEAVEAQLAGSATVWPDQSGNGHDAIAPTAPGQFGPGQIQQDGNNCRGAFAFGNNSYFNFNLPINGWNQMTIFLVSRSVQDPQSGSYASMASVIMWNESAQWGNTFLSPYQQNVAFRFGTTQVGNQPVYARPATIGQDFTVTRAVHDGATDSLYVDGIHVFSEQNKIPALSGTTGSGYIGRGINNTYFNGEISEILVYDRVLTADETAVVEKYLRNKFGTN
jgi:Concanavalin A-like lectin/glucanases superfamily